MNYRVSHSKLKSDLSLFRHERRQFLDSDSGNGTHELILDVFSSTGDSRDERSERNEGAVRHLRTGL